MGEEVIKEVASILGAVDGDIVKAARRMVRLLRLYQWAIGELSLLASDEKKKDEILSKLQKELEQDEDEIIVPVEFKKLRLIAQYFEFPVHAYLMPLSELERQAEGRTVTDVLRMKAEAFERIREIVEGVDL
ncbi:MAG: hypothetical protein ACXQS2_01515 [Methermicoccaceae archaeon]